MLVSMKLLKKINAKTEDREMLLVDCATKVRSVDQQLKKIRTHRRKSFQVMVLDGTILLASFLWEAIDGIGLGNTPYIFIVLAGVAAYTWEASDRRIQLLLLIKHYREED